MPTPTPLLSLEARKERETSQTTQTPRPADRVPPSSRPVGRPTPPPVPLAARSVPAVPADDAPTPRPELPPKPQRSVDPTKPSSGFKPLSALRGEIEHVAISSVLTILEMERKTGVLLIENREHRARLELRKGRIIHATVDEGRIAGANAVYDVLGWTTGGFDLLAVDAGGRDDIQTTTTFLLLEGARRADEVKQAKAADDNRPVEHRKL